MVMLRVGIKLWLDFNQLPLKMQKRSFHVLLITKHVLLSCEYPMLISNGPGKGIWNSLSVVWIKDLWFFFIKTIIKKHPLWKTSYHKIPNCLVQAFELTRFRIIAWPDHFHFVLFQGVRGNILRRIWRFNNLANDKAVKVKNVLVLLDGKVWLTEVKESILWKSYLFHRTI